MIDHLLFNSKKYVVAGNDGTVQINGEMRYTGVPMHYLGRKVKSTTNDSSIGLAFGDTGTVIGVPGYILTPNLSVNDSNVKSGINKLQSNVDNDFLIVKLDNGKVIFTPGNSFNLY